MMFPRTAYYCTARSPGNPNGSGRLSPRRSSCGWKEPSRRTITSWAPRESS
ncbi:hypothetical protein SKAU_G00395890 [Synaphobranchus kaupii]|uniref:Uncharacterized protein n=1 Tax=Synaphobranchus kaupii TaxID=118154 RepID=A0A9Q1ECI9_SYNKA|nr:hypothetical protein SKAU_G00395890 [Synaphobranchus kaupii]